VKAGVMLAGEDSTRLERRACKVLGRENQCDDGPFAETKEHGRAGLDVASEVKGRGDRMAQARPVRGTPRSRFARCSKRKTSADEFTPELREQEERLRAEMESEAEVIHENVSEARPSGRVS